MKAQQLQQEGKVFGAIAAHHQDLRWHHDLDRIVKQATGVRMAKYVIPGVRNGLLLGEVTQALKVAEWATKLGIDTLVTTAPDDTMEHRIASAVGRRAAALLRQEGEVLGLAELVSSTRQVEVRAIAPGTYTAEQPISIDDLFGRQYEHAKPPHDPDYDFMPAGTLELVQAGLVTAVQRTAILTP